MSAGRGLDTLPLRVPRQYDPDWLERFIRETLSLADIRNATEGLGVTISSTPDTVATIAASEDVQDLLDASLLTATSSDLPNARKVTDGSGISLSDTGAGGFLVINVDDVPLGSLNDVPSLSVLGSQDGSPDLTAPVTAIPATANDRLLTRVADVLDFTQLTADMFPDSICTSLTGAQLTFAATEIELTGALDLNGNATVPTGWTLTTEGGTLTIAGTGETLATFADDGAVVLYFNNSAKLDTKTDGVNVVGELEADSLDIDGTSDISGDATFGGRLFGPDGAFNAPTYSFTSETSGMYIASVGTLAFSTAGIPRLFVSASNIASANVASASLEGGTNAFIASGSASISAIASGNEVDLTGTTIDINGNLDADGTTLDIDAATTLTLHGSTADITLDANGVYVVAPGQSTVTLESVAPFVEFYETNADANETKWFLGTNAGAFRLLTSSTDELSIESAYIIERTALNVDSHTFYTDGGTARAVLSAAEIDLTATTLDFNGNVDISGSSTFGGTLIVSNTAPRLRLTETDAAATNQVWDWTTNSEQWLFRTRTDADGAGATFFTVDRTGTAVDQITLAATEVQIDVTTLDFNGAADISGALTVNGDLANTNGVFSVSGTTARYRWVETDAAADNGKWGMYATGETLTILPLDDTFAGANNALLINRTGTTVDEVELNATTLDLNGNLDADGTTLDIDGATSLTLHGGSVDITLAGSTLNATLGGSFEVDGPNVWISSTAGPYLRLSDDDATSGARNFRIRSNNTQLVIATEDDSNTQVETAIVVTVNGSSQVTEIQLDGDALDLNANMTVPSGWTLTTEGGTFTVAGTGETLATFADDGAVTLYHNNTSRIATSSTGVNMVAGKFLTVASASGGAGINLPHGAAPSAPVDGDMWTTTAGLFVRINGSTVGPLS